MKTLLDPGDEVVIFAPYFVEYMFYADNQGGTCRVAPTDENWLPDIDALATAITPKTSIVLVNSPNNPTGVVYSAEILAGIGEVIRAKEAEFGTEISLVSDEPYRKLLFDGAEYPQIFPHHPRSIVATSHSKDLALPGERIGMIAVSPDYPDGEDVVDGLTFCNRTLGFVNAPALMQHIIARLQDVTIDVGEYESSRDFLYSALTDIGYSVVRPDGAFYMFPRSPIEDDVVFVDQLKQHRVLVVPGLGFGMPGHFRISFCVSEATLQGSIEGFRQAFNATSG
jgi:aspartate aminotransferase